MTGEASALSAVRNFWDLMSTAHMFPTGGTTVKEHWSHAHTAGDTLGTTQVQESCTTYNNLKLAHHLFGFTEDALYADFMEKGMVNGVLPTYRGPGEYLYMLPLGTQQGKAVSTSTCCLWARSRAKR